MVDNCIEEGSVVGNNKNRAAVAAQPLFKPHRRLEIQMVRWLIEHEQV